MYEGVAGKWSGSHGGEHGTSSMGTCPSVSSHPVGTGLARTGICPVSFSGNRDTCGGKSFRRTSCFGLMESSVFFSKQVKSFTHNTLQLQLGGIHELSHGKVLGRYFVYT